MPYFYCGGVQGPVNPAIGPVPLAYYGPQSPRPPAVVSPAPGSPNGLGVVVLEEADSHMEREERMQEAGEIPLPDEESLGEFWH